jgi:hypothetical protein
VAARSWKKGLQQALFRGHCAVRVRHLYISPGHNFFGRARNAPDQHPIVEMAEVECVAGQGIRGDRFFGFKENYKGQITFSALEVFNASRVER